MAPGGREDGVVVDFQGLGPLGRGGRVRGEKGEKEGLIHLHHLYISVHVHG